jgi:hypothetical protein
MANTPHYVEPETLARSSLFLRPNGTASFRQRSSESLGTTSQALTDVLGWKVDARLIVASGRDERHGIAGFSRKIMLKSKTQTAGTMQLRLIALWVSTGLPCAADGGRLTAWLWFWLWFCALLDQVSGTS